MLDTELYKLNCMLLVHEESIGNILLILRIHTIVYLLANIQDSIIRKKEKFPNIGTETFLLQNFTLLLNFDI